MRVESVNNMGAGMPTGAAGEMDETCKNIQKQIQNKQQELRKLSENDTLDMEEKQKKRQEIQQEIANLNMQLRQRQMELRREKMEGRDPAEESVPGKKETETQNPGREERTDAPKGGRLATGSMRAMISAASAVKQAEKLGSVAGRMEGRAAVLKAEIKTDTALGGDTREKEKELAEMEQKAAQAGTSQISMLGDAGKTMEKATEEEREEGKEIAVEEKKEKEKEEREQRSGRVSP